MAAQSLPHDMKIATKIRAGICAGVSIRVIFDSVVTMNNAPKSYQTFYKIYRDDIAASRASIQEEIGSVVINAAKGGDLKAAELFLRSRAGWSPTVRVEDVDPEDVSEDTGAIDDLLLLLGMEKTKGKEEE
jgi:hypothetical protein